MKLLAACLSLRSAGCDFALRRAYLRIAWNCDVRLFLVQSGFGSGRYLLKVE